MIARPKTHRKVFPMRSSIITDSTKKFNTPHSLACLLSTINGEITNEMDVKCDIDNNLKKVYAIKLADNIKVNDYNYFIDNVKINEIDQNNTDAKIEIFIDNKLPLLSFKFNIDHILLSFMIPVSFFNIDNIYKNIKYLVRYKDITYNVYTSVMQNITINSETYVILFPMMVQSQQDALFKVKTLEYKIVLGGKERIISGLKINKNNQSNILRPYFIIPGRPYPVIVYLDAILLYIKGEMNQRQVAETIKQKYKLTTFSSSTLSRAFRSTITDILKKQNIHIDTLIETEKVDNIENHISANLIQKIKANAKIKITIITNFFEAMPENIFSDGMVTACKLFVKAWFQAFSKYWLISEARSKRYVSP